MTAEGSYSMSEGLSEYRAIDERVYVGHLPLKQCLELQEAAAACEPEPSVLLDSAWLGLETSLAMLREPHPETRKRFSSKDHNAAKQRAIDSFRDVLRNEDLPLYIRASAGVALACTPVYHDMTVRRPFMQRDVMSGIQHLKGVQKAASLLLSKSDHTPEEDQVLDALLPLALLTEHGAQDAWYLTASTRQSWDINAIHRRNGEWARIVMSDEAIDGRMAIPAMLGDLILAGENPPIKHAALRAYLDIQPGLFRLAASERRQVPVFSPISTAYFSYLNKYEKAQASPTVHEADMSLEAEVKQRLETRWYTLQPAGDFDAVDPRTLRIHLLNLEEPYRSGELSYDEQHVMAWMQLHYARTLTMDARKKQAEAQQARIQAGRVSAYDAPACLETADAAEQAAQQYMDNAQEQFDVAQAIFLTAADAAEPKHLGESFEIRLDAAAVPIYKALWINSSSEAQKEAVAAYVQSVTALHEPIRAAEHKLSRDPNQKEMLEVAMLKAALVLLISNSSDETDRNLLLPAPPCRAGKNGEMDLVVFPIDYSSEAYDTDNPVFLQSPAGEAITHERRYVKVGLNRLIPNLDIAQFYSRLVAAARASVKKDGKLRRMRNAALDEITYDVNNAIADASE